MSARAQLQWQVPPSMIARQLGVSVQRMAVVLRAQLQVAAADMTRFAKSRHPWRNRTGAAEAGIAARASGLMITVSHGVYYGVYLEYKHGGRWGVIPATIEYGGGPVFKAMTAAIRELAS